MGLTFRTPWAASIIPAAYLTGVITFTIFCSITVIIHNTFIFADSLLTELVIHTIIIGAAFWLLADMIHTVSTFATVCSIATANLAAVVVITIFSSLTVRIHYTFILADPLVTELICCTIFIFAALWLLAHMSHTVSAFATVSTIAAPSVASP